MLMSLSVFPARHHLSIIPQNILGNAHLTANMNVLCQSITSSSSGIKVLKTYTSVVAMRNENQTLTDVNSFLSTPQHTPNLP